MTLVESLHGLMKPFLILKLKEKSPSLSLTSLLVMTHASINGPSDTKLSLIDSNISLDSQSMDTSIRRCTMLLDLSSQANLSVFNTGLDLYLLGSLWTLLSGCLKLMLRLCSPSRFTLISWIYQTPILNGLKTMRRLRCMQWRTSPLKASLIFLRECSLMNRPRWFMRTRNQQTDLRQQLILVIKPAEELFIAKRWTVFNSKYCKISSSYIIRDCEGKERMNLRSGSLNTFLEFMGDPWVTPNWVIT